MSPAAALLRSLVVESLAWAALVGTTMAAAWLYVTLCIAGFPVGVATIFALAIAAL